MKLEIKHLAAYLPYKVKVSVLHNLTARNGIGGIEHILTTKNDIYKLRLRPLSDLTKEIEVDGEKFVPIDYFVGDDSDDILNACQIKDLSYLPYNLIQKLLEWHFDIFNLIPNNLAIDINTLK
jgi:hypothetical protein